MKQSSAASHVTQWAVRIALLLFGTNVASAQQTVFNSPLDLMLIHGPTITAERLLTTTLAPNDPRYQTPRGAGFDGVAGLIINTTQGDFICTGSLLGSRRDILTAAHCLTDASGNLIATGVQAVFFPSGSTGALVANSSAFIVRDGYTGSVIDDNDVAIIRLSERITHPGVETYRVWNDPFGVVSLANFVGFGASGSGATGVTLAPGARRAGFNNFDFFLGDGVLISDFDSGLPINDASCFLANVCDLGLGAFEVSLGGGDSGGPAFVTLDGQRYIAGVASFGVSIGSPPDVDFELNSSFGELSGHVFTGIHYDWIRSTIVPEPGSLALLAVGLALLGMRKRR